MRQRKVDGETPSPLVLLELVEAARQWLTPPDAQGGIQGALTNLDLMERIITGRMACPDSSEWSKAQVCQRVAHAFPG
jgi:hypothetical protein